MAELEVRLVEVQRNWDNIGISNYDQYVKRYKVWTIESKIDLTWVRLLRDASFVSLTSFYRKATSNQVALVV
jgi:hypothetical protein